MTIEQKIASILAESRTKSNLNAADVTIDEEHDIDDPSDCGEENPDNKKNNVDSQEIGGKQKSSNVVTKNASKQDPMDSLDVKEDVDALINGENLSEEFKQKAATIFEAAIINRVKQEVAKLDEVYESRLDEQVEVIKEGLIEKVDGYLDYVVEQWMEKNEIALERGMKSEILEDFVEGLKGLFEQSYIDIPEHKIDVVDSLEQNLSDLSSKLDEQVETNIELSKRLAGYQIAHVASELSEGLVETDKEKFHCLIEELQFEDIESFATKAQTIRESYFTNKSPARNIVGSVVSDTPITLSEDKIVPVNMRGYLSALDNLK